MLRARRTAASTRAVLGVVGIVLALSEPSFSAHPSLVAGGFGAILCTALLQLAAPRMSWAQVEESIAGVAAMAVIGLENEGVTVLAVVWLAAIACGVLARGGRVHWVGRTVVLSAFALPIVRMHEITPGYAALLIAAMGLLLTSGRLTRELSSLLTQARYDADHDDLTGLLSRAAFRAELATAAARATDGRPVGLLMIDLDGFGKINKTLGHTAGDALLAAAAKVLGEMTEPSCHVGRLGGDEFAILAPGTDGVALAESLIAGLQDCSPESSTISACIGIAQAPNDGDDGEALLMAADIALRIAKRSGTGAKVSTYAGDSLSGDGKRSARYALAKLIDGEGLMMAVQPIVDMQTGAVHAYEALARFSGSRRSPLHWLSLADELGQRAELERTCLREALKLLGERPAGTRLSVNLSAPVLLEPATLAMLEDMPDLAGLIVEVTEQALVARDTQLERAFAPLRARGALLAVDDMGAGYSGLRQVTVVHPRYLKLDRSLVTGIDRDSDRAALVEALIGYAERVGSLLVAEGIEEESELRALLELGVPLGQGYYFARPAPPWPLAESAVAPEPAAAAVVPDGPVTVRASVDQRVADRRVAGRRASDRDPAAVAETLARVLDTLAEVVAKADTLPEGMALPSEDVPLAPDGPVVGLSA